LYLKKILEHDNKLIVSLGGGTPCYANNMELLLNSEDAMTIYLKASLKELVKRLSKNKHNRPLIAHLNSDELLTEFIGKHLFERSNYYSQATNIIDVDNKTTNQIVEEIILSLF
jgi:shikimate kinase